MIKLYFIILYVYVLGYEVTVQINKQRDFHTPIIRLLCQFHPLQVLVTYKSVS
jgi:hypothetical protein